MRTLLNSLDEPTRRAMLTRAAGALLGVSLVPRASGLVLGAEPAAASPPPPRRASADAVIYIYLTGGMSHIDTLDPKPGTDAQGPTTVLSTRVPGIQLGGYLPNLAKQIDKCAIVRSLTTTQGAHERGNYFMHTSYLPLATIRHPAMGAWAMKFSPKSRLSIPQNILINGSSGHPGAGFLGSRCAPLPIGDPTKGIANSHLPSGVTDHLLDHRLALADRFDAAFRSRYPQKQVEAYTDFYRDAVKLMRSKDLEAFDITREPDAMKQAYGKDKFGQGLMLARRLVEHGARYIEIDLGGWDTHQDNFDRLTDLTKTLDTALGALLEDLSSRGMLQRTLVVVATEFGRTPKINDNQGRDHHPRAFSCLLAGGGVKGGFVHGRTDKIGDHIDDSPVHIPDFNATIACAMGLPLDEKVKSDSGRPFTIADKGRPITSLLA